MARELWKQAKLDLAGEHHAILKRRLLGPVLTGALRFVAKENELLEKTWDLEVSRFGAQVSHFTRAVSKKSGCFCRVRRSGWPVLKSRSRKILQVAHLCYAL